MKDRHFLRCLSLFFLYCFLPSATKLRGLCFYTCLSVILFTGGGAVCAIPECIAGGIPACLAAGRVPALGWGVPAAGGRVPALGGVCSRGGGVPAPWGVPASGRYLLPGGDACSRGDVWRPLPESRRLLLRTLRILLECILVGLVLSLAHCA